MAAPANPIAEYAYLCKIVLFLDKTITYKFWTCKNDFAQFIQNDHCGGELILVLVKKN